ncbi:MAG: MarR family transcriptional regulator [Deltaproteobacteria bacterium]|nr:MarR family transcriptional regulator [Deltaproteobacteria bacterium]MBW2136979.1 MarR family transcriptional regulator [Deltaproteobacteria bacterium]
MNEIQGKINEDLLNYQTLRLKGLISEMVQCCEDRKFYETQRFGLPYSEVKCLMLFEGERYLTVKGIAQKLEVAKSRVTKITDGLIEKGLVKRLDDPNDARVKLISLTREGERISREIEAFHREIHRDILLELDDDERKNVLAYLELLRSAMEAVKERFV